MKSITFSLPLKVESLNTILRSHWAARRRTKNQWALILKTKTRGTKRIYKRVKIHSFRSRLLDYDNLVGGAKETILDNLKDLGLIKDDDPKNVIGFSETTIR